MRHLVTNRLRSNGSSGPVKLGQLSSGADKLPDLLAALAGAIADDHGLQTVAISLYRPAWNDYEVVAVHGEKAARASLLGSTGDGAPTRGLVVPLHNSKGEPLGVLAVPELDKAPDSLAVQAWHAAQAIESALDERSNTRYRAALEHWLRVSAQIAESHSLDGILDSVCNGISDALGFELVAIEMADENVDRYRPAASIGISLDDAQFPDPIARFDRVFEPAFQVEGCYLLSHADAVAYGHAEPSGFASQMNGRGPSAWDRHWLLVPLHDGSGKRIGFVWADEPADRLLPSRQRLQALRLFANQAAAAISSAANFEALRETGEALATLIDQSPIGIVRLDTDARIISLNPAAERIYGWRAEDVVGKEPPWIEDDLVTFRERYRKTLYAGDVTFGDFVDHRADGTPLNVNVWSSPLTDSAGKAIGLVATVSDVTARKRAESDLERRNAELEALYGTTLAFVDQLDPRAVLETIVARACELLTASSGFVYLVNEELDQLERSVEHGVISETVDFPIARGRGLVGRVWAEEGPLAVADYASWSERLHEYDDVEIHALAAVPLRAGTSAVGVLGVSRREEEGKPFAAEELVLLARFGQLASLALENARLYEAARLELDERRRAEEALRKGQELYRKVLDNTVDVICMIDLEGRFVFASPSYRQALGYTPEELVGRSSWDLAHPEDLGQVTAALDGLFSGSIPQAYSARIKHRDGHWITMEGRPSPIFDEEGRPEHVLWVGRDLTHQLANEEARERLEEQLRQSQKMEAVGRLAGGIAHDFNNLVTAITGYGELALESLPPDAPVRRHLGEMTTAAERAAGLTRQLLAFSRKQVLQPEVLDLNSVISELSGILTRVVGEHIELVTDLQPELGPTKADPGQIEQVVMNLVINARDAMPQGGELTLSTMDADVRESSSDEHGGAEPGRYVCVCVSDTGAGMYPATLERVFEPFFTTKPLGEGTGLGLSTVYGIVNQTGGHVWATSEHGKGSTFRVYLPRAEAAAAVEAAAAGAEPHSRGAETVLLVEDEEVVRNLVREVLESLGYTVLEAANAHEALDLAEEHAREIGLVVTDVVMPGLSGQQLVAELRSRRHLMPVLFTSGYTEEAITNHGVLSPGTAFLSKPFTMAQLGEKLREVLDASRAA